MCIRCRLEMIFWLFKNFVEIKINSVKNGRIYVNLEIHTRMIYHSIIWYLKNLDRSLNGLSIILFHGREIGSNHDLVYNSNLSQKLIDL